MGLLTLHTKRWNGMVVMERGKYFQQAQMS
jgi:hypothetical protein